MPSRESFGRKLPGWWRKFRTFAIVVGVVSLGLLVWHYWFSIRVTSGLKFPEAPRVLVLDEVREVSATRGVFNEKYGRVFGPGEYREVLSNEHGSFFLAPPLGYLVGGGRSDGLGVGGIYLPNDDSGKVYAWDYLLKNDRRDLNNPSPSRNLTLTEDQPERALFLDPDWYENKGWSLLGRPMIEEDFVLNRSLFRPSK